MAIPYQSEASHADYIHNGASQALYQSLASGLDLCDSRSCFLGRGLKSYRDRIAFVNNHMPSETQTPYGDLLGPRDGPREFEWGK